MASDSIAARRQLLADGLAEVDPQIRGLRDKVNDEITPPLKEALQARLNLLQDRHNKIVMAQEQQDQADSAYLGLESDGFPALPDTELSQALLDELAQEGADDDAMAAGFGQIAQAASISVSLGTPADKPEAPTQRRK